MPDQPTVATFREALGGIFADSLREGNSFVDVKAGDLHKAVGGYPQRRHRMPTCCLTMRAEMKGDDQLLSQPPKGAGATLLIRYHLPR